MTTLIVTNKMLTSLSYGYDLRVWHLSRERSKHEKLVLLAISLPGTVNFRDKTITAIGEVFQEVHELTHEGKEKTSMFRHSRMSEAENHRLAYPGIYQNAVGLIKASLERYKTDRIIVTGSDMAGIIRFFCNCKVLLDAYDSRVLAMERELTSGGNSLKTFQKIKVDIQLSCWKKTEGMLPHWFTHVMTINRADTDTIWVLSGGMMNVSTIPNGVDSSLENLMVDDAGTRRKKIVFWGYLDFGPNRSTLRYFYENVYRPYFTNRNWNGALSAEIPIHACKMWQDRSLPFN